MVGGAWAGSCEQAGSFMLVAMLMRLARMYEDGGNGSGRVAGVKIVKGRLLG